MKTEKICIKCAHFRMRPFSAPKKFGTPDALIYGGNVVLPCCTRPGTVGHASPYMERAPDGGCGVKAEHWEAKP